MAIKNMKLNGYFLKQVIFYTAILMIIMCICTNYSYAVGWDKDLSEILEKPLKWFDQYIYRFLMLGGIIGVAMGGTSVDVPARAKGAFIGIVTVGIIWLITKTLYGL